MGPLLAGMGPYTSHGVGKKLQNRLFSLSYEVVPGLSALGPRMLGGGPYPLKRV